MIVGYAEDDSADHLTETRIQQLKIEWLIIYKVGI